MSSDRRHAVAEERPPPPTPAPEALVKVLQDAVDEIRNLLVKDTFLRFRLQNPKKFDLDKKASFNDMLAQAAPYMDNPGSKGYAQFMAFCEGEFSTENLQFYTFARYALEVKTIHDIFCLLLFQLVKQFKVDERVPDVNLSSNAKTNLVTEAYRYWDVETNTARSAAEAADFKPAPKDLQDALGNLQKAMQDKMREPLNRFLADQKGDIKADEVIGKKTDPVCVALFEQHLDYENIGHYVICYSAIAKMKSLAGSDYKNTMALFLDTHRKYFVQEKEEPVEKKKTKKDGSEKTVTEMIKVPNRLWIDLNDAVVEEMGKILKKYTKFGGVKPLFVAGKDDDDDEPKKKKDDGDGAKKKERSGSLSKKEDKKKKDDGDEPKKKKDRSASLSKKEDKGKKKSKEI
jgi:hypothetical protein